MSSDAISPAKVILNGEHFVVHGARAVSASIDLYLKVKLEKGERDQVISNGRLINAAYAVQKVKEITGLDYVKVIVNSKIPKSAGLGSSAAFHTALVIASYKHKGLSLKEDEIFKHAMDLEKVVHKNPSGIDVWSVLKGGVIIFKRGETPSSINSKLSKVLLIDSKERRNTGKLVSSVGELKEKMSHFNELVELSDSLSLSLKDALEQGDEQKACVIFKMAQSLLKIIGVSTEKIDKLVNELEKMSYCAKITGAGGGGFLIALPPNKLLDMPSREVKIGVKGALDLNFY